MSHRRRIVLVSAAVLLGIVVLVIVLGGVATRSEYGRERVRRFVAAWASSKVRGTMYVGRISGNFFDGVTVDSLEIRDENGEVFVSSGRTTVRYDVRDLFDRRLLLNHVHLRNPTVHLRQYANGTWNFRRIFPGGQPEPIGRRRGFGDFILIDSATIEGGRFLLTRPADEGRGRTWRWENFRGRLGYTRLAHPDSTGRVVTVRDLSVDERDPPFAFREVRGTLRQLADSIWLDVPRWGLPGSSGAAGGRIVWGSDRPIRYDVRVRGDRVALADVAWLYPTFPRSGTGRVSLHVRNAPRDERIVEYVLTDLDVAAHGSRVAGAMTVDPSGKVLAVRDVALRASPVDFDLLRVLNGGPFPYNWQGSFTGTVAASGGRVDRFRVDRADVVFTDRNVRGAVSRGSVRGVLDISEPALTVFHGTNANIEHLDLRTLQYLDPEFPRLDGAVSGTATLDSLWLDVRFRGADIVHRDGPGAASRFTGSGRVTWGERFLTYDVGLVAQPVSWTTMARSYPAIPFRGEMSGPIRVRGSAPSLRVETELAGASGSLTYAGTIDLDEPEFAARGGGTFRSFDMQGALRARRAPPTSLTGRYEIAFAGADAHSLSGGVFVALEPSRIGDVRVLPSFARARIAEGLIHLDTARLRTRTGEATAAGTIALTASQRGRVTYDLALDSLEAVAPALSRLLDDSIPSLRGRVASRGEIVTGSTRGATGTVEASSVSLGKRSAQQLRGSFTVADSARVRTGEVSISGDTIRFGRLRLDRADIAVRLPLTGEGAFRAELVNENATRTITGGRLARHGDTLSAVIDSAIVRVEGGRTYRAIAPARVALTRGTIALDSLLLAVDVPARAGTGTLAVRDIVWSRDSLRGSVRTREMDLGILGGVLPSLTRASGPLTLEVELAGRPRRPRATGAFGIRDGVLVFAGNATRYERVTADILFTGDSVRIREISAETARGGGRRGRARVAGSIDLTNYGNPVFALEATAQGFRALDRRGLATLDVSTRPVLSLTGPYHGAVLSGSLVVDEGTIYLPERLDKEVTDLDDPAFLELVDTTTVQNRRLIPTVPSAFVTNLALQDVNLVVDEDVWLRSSEANIELGGSLRVTRTPSRRDEEAQLALVGTLNAVRGTYVLNLAVVQPTFEVERGTLRFFGTPEINPGLDIRAIHTVRQPRRTVAREDVRILVAITGTLRNPQLTLSSADSLPLSQSDLLSYLVTGEPSFALTGTSSEYAEQLLTLGGRLAGTLISARIPRSVFDIVEVRTGAVRLDAGTPGLSGSYLNTLYNTRVILGKQLSDRWYLGLSTGLCRSNFAENLGLRLEYRFSSTYFAQGGIEPGSGELSCVGPATSRTFQQTPPQLGFDLFRTWRF